jgi:hypothetical protein
MRDLAKVELRLLYGVILFFGFSNDTPPISSVLDLGKTVKALAAEAVPGRVL